MTQKYQTLHRFYVLLEDFSITQYYSKIKPLSPKDKLLFVLFFHFPRTVCMMKCRALQKSCKNMLSK